MLTKLTLFVKSQKDQPIIRVRSEVAKGCLKKPKELVHKQ